MRDKKKKDEFKNKFSHDTKTCQIVLVVFCYHLHVPDATRFGFVVVALVRPDDAPPSPPRAHGSWPD